MSLLPAVKVTKLKQLLDRSLQGIPSLEVVDEDGNYMATLIIPQEVGGVTIYDDIKISAEYLGSRSNTVLGPDAVNAVYNKESNLTCRTCGFTSKSEFGLNAHRRSHKKDAVPVGGEG